MIRSSEHLGMLGLGIMNDTDIVDGIHLRWFFNPDLGFPKHGFMLYRRVSQWRERGPFLDFPSEKIERNNYKSPLLRGKLKFETDNEVVIEKKGSHRGVLLRDHTLANHKYLEIHFPETMNAIWLTFYSSEKAELKITHCFESTPLERTIELKKGVQEIAIEADAIDSIRLEYLAGPKGRFALIERIEWILISESDKGWTKLKTFYLPVTHEDYQFSHGYSNDWEAARRRLDEKKQGTYDEGSFEELQSYLVELVKGSKIPQHERVVREYIAESSFKVNPEPVEVNPLEIVLTSALDPGTAQILGLYYIDRPKPFVATIEVHGVYDYKIEGHWTRFGLDHGYQNDEEKPKDMYSVDFFSINLDDPPLSFKKYGFRFQSTYVISIEEPFIVGSFEDSLIVHEGPRIKIRGYLRIDFPRSMSMIHVNIKRIGEVGISVRIHEKRGDAGTDEIYDSSISEISKIFENYHGGIESIEIFGDFYLSNFSYAEMDYSWIIYNMQMKVRDKIAPPTGLCAFLLPGQGAVKGVDQKEMYVPATVGLKWDLPSPSTPSTDRHVFYQLLRFPPLVQLNGDKPILVPKPPKNQILVTPKRPFYVDAGDTNDEGLLEEPLERGSLYGYKIKGIDIFGRHSPYSLSSNWIYIEDTLPPPPPLVTSGKFLDPKDPYLQKEEREWVANAQAGEVAMWNKEEGWVAAGENGEGTLVAVGEGNRRGFRIVWKWTKDLCIQAPDAKKFRIYFKQGLLNVVEGTVHEVLSENRGLHLKGKVADFDGHNRAFFEIRTDKEVDVDSTYNKFFEYHGDFFSIVRIVSSTWDGTTQRITFEVETSLPGTVIEKEEPGVFDVDYSRINVYFDKGIEIWQDSFAGIILRQRGKNFLIIGNEPSQSTTDESGNPVERVTCIVQNLTLYPREIPEVNKPASFLIDQDNPLYTDYSDPQNWKMVDQNGNEFTKEVGMNEGIIVKEDQFPGGDIISPGMGVTSPEIGIIFSDGEFMHILFDIYLPEDSIPEQYHMSPTAHQPTISGYIAITTVDESGNESRVSPLMPVFAVLRDKPEIPTISYDIPELWATIPDYYGVSHFDIGWLAPEKAYFYQVYRAMDKTLILVDMEEHSKSDNDRHAIVNNLIEELFSNNVESMKALIPNDVGPLDTKIKEWKSAREDQKQKKLKELIDIYMGLRNATWRYLASLPENGEAFTPVSDPLDPNTMSFRDSIEGKGRNRYFYRIGAMDKAGNRSSLSVATPPVRVPDVIPPNPPVVTKVLGGDRKAVIRWKRNTEPGMKEYRIYRTDKKEDAADVRLMGEPVVVNADAEGMVLRAHVIKNSSNEKISGYLDVPFIPNAQLVDKVYEVGENGKIIPEVNYFGGFKLVILNVLVDDGIVDVQYSDGSNASKRVEVVGGQVKIEIGDGESPITSIAGVYRKSDTSQENILGGISSGRIVLQGEDISSLRGKRMAVEYNSMKRTFLTNRIPYELEYSDDDLEAGTYYYRIVAARDGVIGRNSDANYETIELVSFPTKLIATAVYDASPPEPPTITTIEWVRVGEYGTVYPYTDSFPEGEIRYPAVHLVWTSPDPELTCLVQFQAELGCRYSSASEWLPRGRYEYIHKNEFSFRDQEYRLKVINRAGNANTAYAPAILPAAPSEGEG